MHTIHFCCCKFYTHLLLGQNPLANMNDFYMDRLDMVRLEYDRHVGISVEEMEKKKIGFG